LPAKHESDEAEEDEAAAVVGGGAVALVLLAEAHVAVTVPLRHASVVHHEEVDLEVVGACPPDLVVLWNNGLFAMPDIYHTYIVVIIW
jgi:hypothetical protein